MLNCIIIEDQPPAQRILKKYISDIPELELKNTFPDAVSALEYLKHETVDVIFLDINLPKISGMEFLNDLKNQPYIIMTTAFSEFALESYEHHVIDYLLKPFAFDRFKKAINKILELENNLSSKNEDTVYVKTGHELFKLNCNDIIFITSDGDYTEIYTQHKVYLSSDTLKQWLEKLDHYFCQIHKSYIINMKHLSKISANKIFLSKNHILPIGRAYKKNFTDKFSEH
ncbi:LytR/AlgR family response regulator transcription factor [Formosa sp. A9]|uniref:LytR/AlgR family response regulator transcription factor n=1 Tax=Formosa sp. A9 TaxID=3442641 RepID=UPI003EB974A6